MKKFYFFLLGSFLFFNNKQACAQLLQWDTGGNTGLETSEPSFYNDPGVLPSIMTLGPGIVPFANANRFGGSNWFDVGNTSPTTLAQAIADNEYMEFTVVPVAGFSFTATLFTFHWDRSATGPTNVALRSSLDGFTANLFSIAPAGGIAPNNVALGGSLANITTPVTFRLYGFGATDATGNGGFDYTAPPGVVVELNGFTTPIVNAPLIISEFRYRWPNGVNDEYIEIYNASLFSHTVTAAGGTGYAIAASDGTTRGVIPNGTVIPPKGHFLIVNSVGYSLANYGGTGAAAGDATYTTD